MAYSIDIGVWVFSLAVLGQDTRCNLVDLANELEHGVIGKVFQGKLALGDVARVCLSENSMSIAWYDLARLERRPQVICNSFVAKIATNGFLHLL